MINKIIAIQGDHPSKLNPLTDTTIFLANEIQKKKYKILYYEPKDLSIINSKIIAKGFFVEFNYKRKIFFKILKKQKMNLSKCKFILIRQDPPFNLEYISTTYILDKIKDKVKIINDPTSIRNISEKLYSAKFYKYMPSTIFTKDIYEIKKFFKQHNQVILKPIHSYSGNNIHLLKRFNSNFIKKFLQNHGHIMCQKYLSKIIYGDKRVFIINGQVCGAKIADIGGTEILKNIKEGNTEIEISISGRDKMEREIVSHYPDAEYMDTWVWFQSGINTDGAHNPKTNRKIQKGDILSLNAFPMISGYYTALERTLFLDHANDASLKAWEANVKVHKRGLELIKPGAKCSEICNELNELFAELGYLQYRTFGYGHSFGVLSHFYGREAGLELREDIDTVLEENMVVSMEPMIMIPEGKPGAGGYREHDILIIGKDGAENITKFPFGPEHNIIKA